MMASSPPPSLQEEHQGHEGDAEREATEMGDFNQVLRRSSSCINASAPRPSAGNAAPIGGFHSSMRESLAKFWQRQVSATVPHDACRDHYALERTFLGYLRTSLALSMVSVIIAQLYRLEHSQTPNKVFGFFVLGIPLACVCVGAATLVLLLGAYRFWRQQNAILRGKVHAGGWDINAIGLTITLVVITLFVLLVAVDLRKDTLDAT